MPEVARDEQPVPPPRRAPSELPRPGVLIFVAILALFSCGLLGPVAWWLGGRYVAACNERGELPDGMGVDTLAIGRLSTLVGAGLLLVAVVAHVVFGR